MPRLAEPKIQYLPYNESFTWDSRNLPVFNSCSADKGYLFCVSHKVMLSQDTLEGVSCVDKETHLEHKSTHILVWYCLKHQRMEEA